jgi:hypothetical protein
MLIVDPNYDGDKVRGCSPPPVLTPAQNEGVEVAASSSPSPPSLDYFVPTNNEDIRPIKINTHFQIPLKVLTQSSLSGGGSDSAYHSFLSDDASENSSPGSKHGYQSQNKHPTESSFLTRLNIAGSTFCENNRLGTAEGKLSNMSLFFIVWIRRTFKKHIAIGNLKIRFIEDSPCVRLRQRLETPNSEQKRGSHVLRRKQLPPPLKKPYKKENSTPSIGITQQLEKSTTPCNKINFHKISKNVPNTFPKCSPLRISLIKAPLAPSPPKSVGNVVKKRSGNNFRSHLTIKQVDSEEGFSGGGTPRLNIKTLKNHHRTLRLISDWRPASEGVFCKVKIAIGQPPAMHLCYTAVRHRTMQEVVSVGDCVKIHSSENLENVGRIISLHYDEEKCSLSSCE